MKKKVIKIQGWTVDAETTSKGTCLDLHIYDGRESREGWLIAGRLVLVKR